MNSLEYIKQNYTVVWQHPEALETDWNRFLLEDDHGDEEVNKTNGFFISQFAPEGSLLLVEAQECLKQSKRPNSSFKRHLVETPNIPPERVFGWDMKNILGLIESKTTAAEIAIQILWPFHDPSTKLLGSVFLGSLDWQNMMLHIWDMRRLQMHPEIQAQDDIMACMADAILVLAPEMQEFAKRNIQPLEEQLISKHQKIQELETKVLHCDQNELEIYAEQYEEAFTNCLKCKLDIQIIVGAKVHELITVLQLGDQYFPKRTHSMVKTLQKIESIVDIGQGNLYLIAGGYHLEEKPHSDQENMNLFSLKELYNYIKDHKNIVILKPK